MIVLLVTINLVPRLPILFTLLIEGIYSSETSVLIRATRRHIPGESILHSHSRENLKSCINKSHFKNENFTSNHFLNVGANLNRQSNLFTHTPLQRQSMKHELFYAVQQMVPVVVFGQAAL
jgi:hypothetical protein